MESKPAIVEQKRKNFDSLNQPLMSQDKVDLLLLTKGLKPASMIQFGCKPGLAIYSETDFANDIQLFEQQLSDLSLPYEIARQEDMETATQIATFLVGANALSLERLQDAFKQRHQKNGDRLMGEALGYPATAIEGFVDRNVLDERLLPKGVQDSPDIRFLNFRLSNDHWQSELEYIKKRAQIVKDLDPDLYHEIITHPR